MNLLVNIDVDDLEKAIEFYTNALALKLGRRLFANTVAAMLGASSTIYLLANVALYIVLNPGEARRDRKSRPLTCHSATSRPFLKLNHLVQGEDTDQSWDSSEIIILSRCEQSCLVIEAKRSDARRLRNSGHMLGPNTHADQARWNSAQYREAGEHPNEERELERTAARQHSRDDAILDRDLETLCDACGQLSSSLHTF
jgi:predicted lactoylglutathione lyase